MPVMDSIKAIGHGIGWLIPGVQEAQAMEASANAHRQKSLNDAINRAIQYETANPRGADEDPDYKDRLTRLFDMQGKVQQMGPFDNPKSLGGQFWHDYVSLHPDALMPGQAQKPKVTATPGPPMQGQPMGQPNVSVQIPPVGGPISGPTIGPSGMPEQRLGASTAMPGTSPASPEAQAATATATAPQGGGNSPSAAFPSSQPTGIAGVGDTGVGDGTPTFRTEAAGLSPTPPSLVMPPRPAPIHLPVSLSGDVSQPLVQAAMSSQQPYIQAQAAAEQALNTLRGTTEFNMAEAPRKLLMIQQAMGPELWGRLPDPIKADVVGSLFGVNIPGAMAVPRILTPAATGADLKKQYAGQPEFAGLDDKTFYRVEFSPLQGYIVNPTSPQFLPPVQMSSGQMGAVSKAAPGESPTPIPGSIAPSLVTPQTQTQVQPTPGGGQRTVKTEQKTVGQVAPIGGTAALGAAAPTKPAPKAGPTAPKAGTQASDVTRRVDTFGNPISPARVAQINNAAIAVTQPNMSTSQQSEQLKMTVGNDKWLGDQVRARIATDQLPTISWDLSMAQRAQFSNQALTHMNKIDTLVKELDENGQMGPLMSRWNDFMQGKIGKDTSIHNDYTKLKNQIDLLTKALGVVHGGARGGGSIQMYQSFLDKINVGKMDAATLNAALGVEKDWLSTYANPAATAGVHPNPAAAAGGVMPIGVPKVGDAFGGGKVLKVERVQ